jgi:hypothetical protein
MEPRAKRTKKKNKIAKKSVLNTGKPAGQAEKRFPAVPTSDITGWRDKEELVDYEPEDPPTFSPTEDDLSVPGDRSPTPEQGPADIPPFNDDLPAYPAEEAVFGEEQSHTAARDESSALPRSGGKPVCNERDESAALPRSGGKPVYNDRDEPAALPSVLKPRANLGETRS